MAIEVCGVKDVLFEFANWVAVNMMSGRKEDGEGNLYRPSAPVSTGTIPRHCNKPDFEGLYDVEPPTPSAPPLEHMEQVAGYETLTFSQATVPPPDNLHESWFEEESRNRAQKPSLPMFVTEKNARECLIKYANDQFCYGTSAARDMSMTAFQYTSAFHYELQTFTERRETCWKYVPYRGTEIDGSENGPAPLPWAIEALPTRAFQNEEKFIRVPHTESMKQCHACKGSGTLTCAACAGKGWNHCHLCNGRGIRQDGPHEQRCLACAFSHHGKGHQECQKCRYSGKLTCPTCEGSGHILCYISLTITWKVVTSEHIIEDNCLPEEMVRFVSGEVQYEEEGSRVLPIKDCPDEAIKLASVQLIRSHMLENSSQQILAQRHQVRIVPITSIRYNWKGKEGVFFICGFENKVYAPDYPQTVCCGCTIV